jgi:hypothetical protein
VISRDLARYSRQTGQYTTQAAQDGENVEISQKRFFMRRVDSTLRLKNLRWTTDTEPVGMQISCSS